jgi:hypothetical protein
MDGVWLAVGGHNLMLRWFCYQEEYRAKEIPRHKNECPSGLVIPTGEIMVPASHQVQKLDYPEHFCRQEQNQNDNDLWVQRYPLLKAAGLPRLLLAGDGVPSTKV